MIDFEKYEKAFKRYEANYREVETNLTVEKKEQAKLIKQRKEMGFAKTKDLAEQVEQDEIELAEKCAQLDELLKDVLED